MYLESVNQNICLESVEKKTVWRVYTKTSVECVCIKKGINNNCEILKHVLGECKQTNCVESEHSTLYGEQKHGKLNAVKIEKNKNLTCAWRV